MKRHVGFVCTLLATIATLSGRAQQVNPPLLPGDILVVDFEAGTDRNGALFWVNRTTGARTLLSGLAIPHSARMARS